MPEAIARPRNPSPKAQAFAEYLAQSVKGTFPSEQDFSKMVEEARDVARVVSEESLGLP